MLLIDLLGSSAFSIVQNDMTGNVAVSGRSFFVSFETSLKKEVRTKQGSGGLLSSCG